MQNQKASLLFDLAFDSQKKFLVLVQDINGIERVLCLFYLLVVTFSLERSW